jgi:alkanesulfonate monooxygenase SsuD/methylene tetrahydromethanopterin reductase-like flavin-dependent oxidoreductase (luciferase family)
MTTTAPERESVELALMLDLAGSIGEAVELSTRAEQAGLDAVYAIEGFRDPFVPLAAIATATSRIRLGTYVANAYARSPAAAASAALNLDELSGGRFLLGLGAGNRHINDWWHGVDSSKPLRKTREYLAVVRAILQARRGDKVDVEGSIHRAQARIARDPVAARIPVVLAAAGPRMIELAATASDGVGVGILVSADHLAEAIRPRALAALEAAGGDPAGLRVMVTAMVNVDHDAERARARARRAICGLCHPVPHPYYDFLLRELGFGAAADAATELAPRGRWAEAAERIDDEIVDRLTVTGTPEQCAAQLTRYRGLADEVVCLPTRTAAAHADDASAALFEMVALARGQ